MVIQKDAALAAAKRTKVRRVNDEAREQVRVLQDPAGHKEDFRLEPTNTKKQH